MEEGSGREKLLTSWSPGRKEERQDMDKIHFKSGVVLYMLRD